jgi:hypothetical protein
VACGVWLSAWGVAQEGEGAGGVEEGGAPSEADICASCPIEVFPDMVASKVIRQIRLCLLSNTSEAG